MNWQPVTADKPAAYAAHHLYRVGDLYPVVGFRIAEGYWMLWEGGQEDSPTHQCPRVGGGDPWEPTHYAEIDFEELWRLGRRSVEAPQPTGDPK